MTTTSNARSRVRWVVGLIAVGVAVTCVRLGLWQWDRHRARAVRNTQVEARGAAPPIDLAVAWPESDSLEYRRAVAQGRFDFRYQVVEAPRAVRGVPAVYVVTPLRLGPDRAILVERGWVPSPDAASVELGRLVEPESTTVRGVLVRLDTDGVVSGTGWPLTTRRADPRRLAERLPYALAPYVLRRTDRTPGLPEAMGIVPLPPPGLGPHLSYTVQWFVFALIALIGPVAVWRVKRREPSPGARRDV